MYHVIDNEGREVFKSENLDVAKRAADSSKAKRLNGSAEFNVERRDRVYTTTTLEDAIRGTRYDPQYRRRV